MGNKKSKKKLKSIIIARQRKSRLQGPVCSGSYNLKGAVSPVRLYDNLDTV